MIPCKGNGFTFINWFSGLTDHSKLFRLQAACNHTFIQWQPIQTQHVIKLFQNEPVYFSIASHNNSCFSPTCYFCPDVAAAAGRTYWGQLAWCWSVRSGGATPAWLQSVPHTHCLGTQWQIRHGSLLFYSSQVGKLFNLVTEGQGSWIYMWFETNHLKAFYYSLI